MPVRITKQLQTRIFRHLESTWPNEGGGFLLGKIAQDAATVCESIAVENVFEAAEQHHRYAMTPRDWMRLEDEADTRGLALLGYYHSHPDSPAIPSDYDREHALPNFVYLIARVQAGAAQEMLAWRLRTDRSRFDSETLEVVGD